MLILFRFPHAKSYFAGRRKWLKISWRSSFKLEWLRSLCFGCLIAQFAIQHGGFCTMWSYSAKGPLTIYSKTFEISTSAINSSFVKKGNLPDSPNPVEPLLWYTSIEGTQIFVPTEKTAHITLYVLPPLKGHLCSGDTCRGHEGVPWTEVPLC